MRTFVISDAHGYPELIENALEHGGFRPGEDAFIYAGDLLDRGPEPGACIELVDRYAREVLLGNHEVAVILGQIIYPQSAESLACRPTLIDRVLNADPENAWKTVTCVDGVVISHAGFSSAYERIYRDECLGDSALFAAQLDRAVLRAIRQELESWGRPAEADRWGEESARDWTGSLSALDADGLLGDDGPLWFRPRPYSDLLPVDGLRQVVGHTPPLPGFEEAGFHMVDPCAFLGLTDPGRFRYAVIERGQVHIKDMSELPQEVAA